MSPTTNVNERHAAMVRNLIKPGATLQAESTAIKWELLHAIIGITGEIGELEDALARPRHLLEEAGDILFYCRNLREILGFPDFDPRDGVFLSPTILTAKLLDHVKRLTIYNYRLLDYKRLSSILHLLDQVEMLVVECLNKTGFTREDAMEHNLEKLLTGPNARFKDGFSDLAAQLRADKNPDHDDV